MFATRRDGPNYYKLPTPYPSLVMRVVDGDDLEVDIFRQPDSDQPRNGACFVARMPGCGGSAQLESMARSSRSKELFMVSSRRAGAVPTIKTKTKLSSHIELDQLLSSMLHYTSDCLKKLRITIRVLSKRQYK